MLAGEYLIDWLNRYMQTLSKAFLKGATKNDKIPRMPML